MLTGDFIVTPPAPAIAAGGGPASLGRATS
jgi:hypothetical protein